MKSKNGQVAIYSICLGLVIILLGLYLAPAVSESITSAMNNSVGDTIGLDCDNVSISNFDKATCTVSDLTIFWFIGGVIFIGGAVVGSRIIFGG
jgi:hypothetical protein